jgi:hypothetical protein
MPGDKNRRGYGSNSRFRHQLKEASASTYAEYLRSDHWRGLEGFLGSTQDVAGQTGLRLVPRPGRPVPAASQEL